MRYLADSGTAVVHHAHIADWLHGGPRAQSHFSVTLLLVHFMPYLLTYQVPLFR